MYAARKYERKERGTEVCRDKEKPAMVYIVSAVTEQDALMHGTARPRTLQQMHKARHICISIICGCHRYCLMKLSRVCHSVLTEPEAQLQLVSAGKRGATPASRWRCSSDGHKLTGRGINECKMTSFSLKYGNRLLGVQLNTVNRKYTTKANRAHSYFVC